ncbi:hypothetical protein NP493_137g01022, partial [Ridgeia piscesae]
GRRRRTWPGSTNLESPWVRRASVDVVRRQTARAISSDAPGHSGVTAVSDNRASRVRNFFDSVYWLVYVYARRRRRSSMASVLNRRHVSDTGQAVKYTPCLKNDATSTNDVENGDDVMDEISVVCHDGSVRGDAGSPIQDSASRTGSGSGLRIGQDTDSCDTISAPNGPLGLGDSPGPSGAESHVLSAANTNSDRTKLIGKRLSSTGGDGRLNMSSPVYPMDSSRGSCRWTFVFDPAGRLSYWWSMVVSMAFIYNFWVLIFRFAFREIDASTMHTWFIFDYSADFIYLYGQREAEIHYMNSMTFYIDCLCLLPLDFLYLSIGFRSIFRCFRLVKIYRFWAFLDRTERHTNYPNLIRTVTLLHYLLAIYHWNACLIYTVVRSERNTRWKFPADADDVLAMYLHSLYWSTLTLTTIGEMPLPESKGEYAFVIFQFIFALLLFSSVLGHVANIVTAISAARRKFQGECGLDLDVAENVCVRRVRRGFERVCEANLGDCNAF